MNEIENTFHQSSSLSAALDGRKINENEKGEKADEKESTISDLSSLNYDEDDKEYPENEPNTHGGEIEEGSDISDSKVKWVMAFDSYNQCYYW